MKKLFPSVLCILLVFCLMTTSAFAADPEPNDPEPINPEFTRVTAIYAGLSISPTGEASCSGFVYPTYTTDTVTLTVRLQYLDGSTWRNYSSTTVWSTTDSGFYISLSRSAQVTYGQTYRVRVSAECVAESGGAYETVYCNSPIKTYP